MPITFVTTFFDIGRQTDVPMQKFDNYFAWIEELLKLPINLYFFTSPELKARFNYEERRNLKFKLLPEIPYYDKLTEIQEAWRNYITNNPRKDTPEFGAMTHAKFKFLCQAIADDPFGDEYYAWIDAGIFKVALQPELIPKLVPPSKVKMMILNYTSKEEVKDENFVRACRYKCAAGFFIGPKELMRVFCLLMLAQAEYDLYHKRFGLEQEYMAIVYRKYPEVFDPYYGDFSDLIINYYMTNNNIGIVKRVLTEAIKYGDNEEAQRVAKYLLQSQTLDEIDKHLAQRCLNG